MPRISFVLIILIALVYIAGAKWPQLAQKIGAV